jgi:hypothetical protein
MHCKKNATVAFSIAVRCRVVSPVDAAEEREADLELVCCAPKVCAPEVDAE